MTSSTPEHFTIAKTSMRSEEKQSIEFGAETQWPEFFTPEDFVTKMDMDYLRDRSPHSSGGTQSLQTKGSFPPAGYLPSWAIAAATRANKKIKEEAIRMFGVTSYEPKNNSMDFNLSSDPSKHGSDITCLVLDVKDLRKQRLPDPPEAIKRELDLRTGATHVYPTRKTKTVYKFAYKDKNSDEWYETAAFHEDHEPRRDPNWVRLDYTKTEIPV